MQTIVIPAWRFASAGDWGLGSRMTARDWDKLQQSPPEFYGTRIGVLLPRAMLTENHRSKPPTGDNPLGCPK
ncbi:hypothetical protein DSCA_63180 [Desulfosarcina alkanivorans]|uniref:Uncharacterized protein n=1 Tax=Desulfosarcina alkanivorans TaxID=571177 RepID=A0A5K7YUQ5_9BACT|nr:hypothetical protein DSCA_63180 [Desulfosarcina alkanivorans]